MVCHRDCNCFPPNPPTNPFKSQVFGPPKRLSLQEVFGGSDTDPHKQKAIYLETHPN